MKKNIFISIIVAVVLLSSCSVFDKSRSNLKPNKFRWTVDLKQGEYLYNTEELYFFDTSFDCYLYDKCTDIDSIFGSSAKTLKITNDTILKFQAYLFTDTYEYMYVTINKQQTWIRYEIPLEKDNKLFLSKYLHSDDKPAYVQYVEVIPFKTEDKIFVSCYNSWYIINLKKKRSQQIGSKGGRLEACRMLFPKNCVECYIDLGWGETVIFDEDGNKK